MIVNESGDALKMKTIQMDQSATYDENIKKAEELLNEKKYSEAKLFYEKALTLKPDEEYPRKRLDKINSVLNSIDELHKSIF